jgi:predicted Zn-dependent peptidase
LAKFESITGIYSTSAAEELNFSTKLEFSQFELNNGLHCIMYRDERNPIVNVSLGYNVGSKDEDEGKKGIAHLFEHLMFQGSQNIKKNEHFLNIQKAGGSCNAFTMQDLTAYYDILPAHHLETGLWLESDRMNSLDLTEENLENQKSVVIEEKMQRYDNAPYGTALHNIFKLMLKDSYYETPVIGYYDDIRSFTLDEAIQFHSTYYSPANAVLAVSGDIDYGETEKLIKKYFGGIKNGSEIKRKKPNVKPFTEPLRHTVYDNIHLPALYVCYRVPSLGTREEFTLDYFASILANDKSSRLYKKLVYEKKLARSVHVNKYQLKDAGMFIIKVEIIAGKDKDEAEQIIFDEIADIAGNGVTEYEFNKVRNQIEFYNVVKNLTLQKISLETLFNWILFKDIENINKKIYKYLSLDRDAIHESVNEHFADNRNLVLTYLPK